MRTLCLFYGLLYGLFYGQRENRTLMTLLPSDFESDASTNSATRPFLQGLYLTTIAVAFVKYFLRIIKIFRSAKRSTTLIYNLILSKSKSANGKTRASNHDGGR